MKRFYMGLHETVNTIGNARMKNDQLSKLYRTYKDGGNKDRQGLPDQQKLLTHTCARSGPQQARGRVHA